jgi:hypothetical protein
MHIATHAPPTVAGLIAARLHARPRTMQRAIADVEARITALEVDFDCGNESDVMVPPAGAPLDTAASRGKGFNFEAKHLVSRCPTPGELSEAQVIAIIEAARTDHTSGEAAVVQAAIGSLVNVAPLLASVRDGSKASLHILVRPLHACPPNAIAPLFRSASTSLTIDLPEEIEQRISAFVGSCTAPEVVAAIQNWLDARVPGATMPKIEHALLHRAPDWFGVPWALACAGIQGWRQKRPAPASYTLITPTMIQLARPFAEWVLGTMPWRVAADAPGPGSAWVPTDGVIHAIAARIRTIVEDGTGLDDPWRDCLVLAAASHLVLLLLCGARAHPLPHLPATLLSPATSQLLHRQKGMVSLLSITRGATEFLTPLHRRWRRAAQTLDPGNAPTQALFAYPVPSRDGGYPWHAIEAKWLAVGMLADPALAPYTPVIPGLRHWANTVLRECGQYTEAAIREFFGHRLRRFTPWATHCCDPITQLRDRMAATLAERAGLA